MCYQMCYFNTPIITSCSTKIQKSIQRQKLVVVTQSPQRCVRFKVTGKLHEVNNSTGTSLKLDKHLIWCQKYLSRTPDKGFIRMHWSPMLTIANLESGKGSRKGTYSFLKFGLCMNSGFDASPEKIIYKQLLSNNIYDVFLQEKPNWNMEQRPRPARKGTRV